LGNSACEFITTESVKGYVVAYYWCSL